MFNLRRVWLVAAVSLSIASASVEARADEPAEEFLEALRDNGYYDIALQYLANIEKSDLISKEFRKALPFEKAETLIKSATRLRDMNVIEARLNEAEQLLTQYSTTAISSEIAAKTHRYRGNLRLGRSRLYAKRSDSDRLTAEEKSSLQKQTREMLGLALQDYSQARTSLKKAINEFQIDVADPSTTGELKRLRSTYTQIRLKLPMVKEQLADSHPENSPQRKKLLTEAAEEYVDLYDKYRRFAAGLDSGLFASRCYQKLDQHDDALNILKELFELENTGALKKLKRKAVALACITWQKQEPYPADEVIAQCAPLVDALNRQELRQPDWLKIQMELAVAYRNKAKAEGEAGGPGSAGKAKDYNRLAAKLMRNVSRTPSSLRDKAAAIMKDWNLSVKDLETAEEAPESFLDARQKGQDNVAEIESLMRRRADLKSRIAGAKTQDEKDKLGSELAETDQIIAEQSEAALRMFSVALSLVDKNTQRADINKVRYLQTICYFATQQYIEAALIGEFLLNRYPTIDWTQQASSFVVRSYSALHDNAPKNERDDQRDKLSQACEIVINRWPGSRESGAAASRMVQLSLNRQDFEAAEKYYASVPANFFTRPALGLRMGQKIWFKYLKSKSTGTAEETARLLDQAKGHLIESIARINADKISYDAALASLFLVDAHLATGELDKAIARLETEAIAPLDLIKQKHPIVTGNRMENVFRRETYKTAVKVYLAAMRGSSDQQQWINKAIGVVAAMRGDPENAKQLDSVYRAIGKELISQFSLLQTQQEKKKFAATLASFLGAIEKDSKDPKTLLWAGKTLLTIANSLASQSIDAKPLFEQAVSALSRAESLGFAGMANSDVLVEELKRQRALAERGSGNYEAAVNQLGEILELRIEKGQKPLLAVQIDAAETIHQWAKATKQAQKYVDANAGTFKVRDPRTKRQSNAIWGWRKLVQVTRNNPKLADSQIKCMFYLIDSRFQYGVLTKNDKAIDSARRELKALTARNPSLGGPAWKLKFEELKEQIH